MKSNKNKFENKMKVENKEQPYAVYVGLDSFPALPSIRHLAKKGIPIIGIAQDPHDQNCKTNTVKEVIYTNTGNEELITTLEKLGKKFSQKAVLFTGEETNVIIVSRYRERLEKYYHIVMPEKSTVEMLIDKISFYKYCQQENLPIPKTKIIEKDEEVYELTDDIVYPVILKPTFRSPQWVDHTQQKAFKIFSKTELIDKYNEFKDFGSGFVVQEWIDGPDTNHYTCNCYFSKESELLVTFVSRKIRQWPPETGQGCIGIESKNDVVLNATKELFGRLNYKGLGYLDMKLDNRLGKYLIVEPNICRPTGRSANAEAAGVELVYTMYCDAAGLPIPEQRTQTYGNVKWIHERRDFQSFLYHWKRGELTFREWRKSWKGKKIYHNFSWGDPIPFFYDLYRVLKVYLNKNERSKRDFA